MLSDLALKGAGFLGTTDWPSRGTPRRLAGLSLILRAAALIACLMMSTRLLAQALPYSDLHDFGAGVNPCYPDAAVSFDVYGNMYGTTRYGGTYDPKDDQGGTVWEITSAGAFKVLHSFGGTTTLADGESGPDAFNPQSPVIIDGSGNLFGTAAGGEIGDSNTYEYGMIWEITSAGVYKDLHDFGGTITLSNGSPGGDGVFPMGALYRDVSGDLFGTTEGNPGGGMVWELSAAGVYTDLHDFGGQVIVTSGHNSTDGENPVGGITADASGDLFGTTSSGGPHLNSGIIWELTSAGTYKDLHDFGSTIINANGTSGPDGGGAQSNVVFDASGNMFGSASYGGPNNNGDNDYGGMLWEFAKSGAYVDLHDFGGTATNTNGVTGPDGQSPGGQIAIDGQGNLFGGLGRTTLNDDGRLWEMTPAAQYTDLHDFGGTITLSNGTQGTDGQGTGGVTLGPGGHLYGFCEAFPTVSEGGGLIWEIGKEQIESLTLSPSTIGGSGTSVGTVTLAGNAPTGGWKVSLKAGASGYLNLPSSVTVAAGTRTATFTITGLAQRSATLNMGIFASDSVTTAESILTIQGDEVNGLSFSPTTIGGSGSTTATVTISSTAPPGGWIVHPNAAAAGYLSMPATVTVPAGATSTTFTISGTTQRTGTAGIGVIASDGNASVESILTVDGDALKSISLSTTSMGWSGTSTGTLTLNSSAPEGGWVVNLKAGAPGYLSMPASVTIPAGATSATFSVTGASQRTESVTIGVIANDTGNQVETDLTLTGDSLTGVSVNPTSVATGAGSTGTVTLSGPAPVGGWVVKLWAGAPTDVQVPATVTVPAGATSATFSITTPTNAVPSKYGVFANDGTAQFETYLTIT